MYTALVTPQNGVGTGCAEPVRKTRQRLKRRRQTRPTQLEGVTNDQKELLEVAEKYVAQGWGILIVDENENIHVARKAAKRERLFRQETLTEAVIHS